MQYENLAVCVWTGTNSNGRNRNRFSDVAGEFTWNAFDHGREGSCGINAFCVLKYSIAAFEIATLDFVSAHAVIALGCKPDVSHHRNVDSTYRCDGVVHRRAAFEFYG